MGFSLKSIGNLLDSATDIALGVADSIFNESSKELNKSMKRINKTIDNHYNYVEAIGEISSIAIDSIVNTIGKVSTLVINTVKQMIDLLFVREQVKRVDPNALRALILSKKKNVVNVGIFEGSNISKRITINSELGVSDELYKGQVINIY